MNKLAELEEQITLLESINKVTARALDAFGDVSHSISVRANYIFNEVKPWEVSLKNILATMNEISKAAKCYHQPPSLKGVLTGKDRNPDSIAKCADYLLYTQEYLASHPPNKYGETIHAHLHSQLERIAVVSENFVYTAFVSALRKRDVGISRKKEGLRIIQNPKALLGVPQVLSRLSQQFNRTEIVKVKVAQLLETHLKDAVTASFHSAFADESVQQHLIGLPTGFAGSQWHHYHRGEHPLLVVSKEARAVVKEVAACVQTYIIKPMDEDFDVIDMSGDFCRKIFDVILDKAKTTIHFDARKFRDPTGMFLASRGQGIGLYPGARAFQDIIFIGLDILEEMWEWKTFVSDLPGDNNDAIVYVEEQVHDFMLRVRKLLEGYVEAMGGLSPKVLKERSRETGCFEWFPAMDGTAHESSTHMLYYQKMLFSSYFGALKLALFGSTVIDASSDYQASKEVEDYFLRCVTGHMEDIRTIGIVAKELLAELDEKRKKKKSKKSAGAGLTFYWSVNLFVVNNVHFLSQSYRKNPCFRTRFLAPEGFLTRERFPVPIVRQPLGYLYEEALRCVDEFGTDWEKCFPLLPLDLASISPGDSFSSSLKKAKLSGVKTWCASVAANLQVMIEGCKGEAVMDAETRKLLIRKAYETVEQKIEEVTIIIEQVPSLQEAFSSCSKPIHEALAAIRTLF